MPAGNYLLDAKTRNGLERNGAVAGRAQHTFGLYVPVQGASNAHLPLVGTLLRVVAHVENVGKSGDFSPGKVVEKF